MDIAWENPEVITQDLPALEDVRFQHHPIRYRSLRNLIASIFWSIPTIAAIIIPVAVGDWWLFLMVPGVLLLAGFNFYAINRGYRKRSYALREKDITYKKGWIFRTILTIPFNRIQHTEVSQGPLERKYELCTLKIYTAGGATSDLSIPGLEQDEAQQLRDYISKKAANYV